MRRGLRDWQLRCADCGFRASVAAEVTGDSSDGAIDEEARERALQPLRQHNFGLVKDAIRAAQPPGMALIDIGCAHGWFLDTANAAGFEATGLEPDRAIADKARARGHDVVDGFFPQAVPEGARFDVIVFNDVFEHLPDVAAAADDCHRLLSDGGVLAINIPAANGTFYRIAALMAHVGMDGPFRRMWQVGFPSPHLTYFTPATLKRFAARHGFAFVGERRLASTRLSGLWSRLRMDGGGLAWSAVVWCAVAALTPVLRLLPSDTNVHVFRRMDRESQP